MIKRVLSIFGIVLILCSCKISGPVKEPAVAGIFYPAEAGILQNTVDSFLFAVEQGPAIEGRLIAIISPHAGLMFSGGVAAYGFKRIGDIKDIDTVIIVGPSHNMQFDGASVYTEGSFRTPLGEIPIDVQTARALISPEDDVVFLREAYNKEHSLELQLPFLQRVLGEFKIVPVLMGKPTNNMLRHLTEMFTQILAENRKAILIASTDLSHYHDYETAVALDRRTIEAIERISVIEFETMLRNKEGEIDAAYPVIVILEAARRLGANQGVLFKYANSGDVIHEKSSVVGYASMGFYKSRLTEEDKKELLSLARRAIIERVRDGKLITYETDNPRLRADGAAFVTINRMGMLRGCIGHSRPFMPLYKSVIKNAEAASSSDRRFKPMTPDELDDMEIEISVLAPLVPVKDLSEIRLGRDGVYLSVDNMSALFLPQVAPQFGWSKLDTMRELSLKAGLDEDDWKNGTIYRFEAEVFREEPRQGR